MVKINDFDNTGKFLISIVNFDETTDRFLHVGINVQSRIDTFDIIDAYQDFFDLRIHSVQLMARGQARNEPIFDCSAGRMHGIAENHYRLGQVNGGKTAG